MDQPNPKDRADDVTPSGSNPHDHALPPAPPPVSARAWLSQNLPWLIFFAVGLGYCYSQFGPAAVLAGAFALIGLGAVIFIHELGHFLAAKWCDVHVLTFSIGFGPALPGCSFTRGETTYKLALLPLGGYVNMVGEGPEADEDEDYPRSFKNKTVGQRMLIISAGVIMNILFGAACFVVLFLYLGLERPAAIMQRTEAGSRAWEAGIRPGWKLTQIDDKKNPYFDQMRGAVALSAAGRPVEFHFVDRAGKTHTREIEPLREANNNHPVIGVSPSTVAMLPPKRYEANLFGSPVRLGSPAAYARAFDLADGESVVRATDPSARNDVTPLPAGEAGWAELCRRLRAAGKEPITIEVTGGGKTRTAEVPAVGFDFGDVILGTTDPTTPDRPFHVVPLPPYSLADPNKLEGDPFVFQERLVALAGKPMVIQVRREDGTGSVNLLVPPAFHHTLGLRMTMGKVAAVRLSSSSEGVGLQTGPDGDKIVGVSLVADGKPTIVLDDKAMDPVRLPFELERRFTALGADADKYRVVLKVVGPVKHNAEVERTLPPMRWDASWSIDDEAPIKGSSPMSIPQLGIAYWVNSYVVKVEPGSPADRAGLLPQDIVEEFSYRHQSGNKPGDLAWSRWVKMASRRGEKKVEFDQWAHYFWWIQATDYPIFRLKVKRGNDLLEFPPADKSEDAGFLTRLLRAVGLRKSPPPSTEDEKGLVPVEDPTWPLADRGLILFPDHRTQKASSFVEALVCGVDETTTFILQIYTNLHRLLTRRISTESLGGPLEIGSQAIAHAGESFSKLLWFLGVISINLAVVNFLPIPVLDGGHMVFLIYEKLRGRPASEAVRIAATYMGLAIILSLMVFVFYLDFKRRGWI